MTRLVHGVGINDLPKTKYGSGEGTRCPIHMRWRNMLQRCYGEHNRPTYEGCTVCKEWLTFSNFKSWMEKQDWEGKHLDKDLLLQSNKVYSPETCVFVDQLVNSFITEGKASKGIHLIGVHLHKQGKFRAMCNNPFTKRNEHVGLYEEEIIAHLAWKKRKHELSYQLAHSNYVTDERVRQALLCRYSEVDQIYV
ncbi:DNA-binding domain protein [Vibrio phage 1.187.O._10N.286.49.F1]|nr:DNA-binding domain protein [Vibrio phage 1.187.O._10N.286.49.F1]